MIDQVFLQEAQQALLREKEITEEQIMKCEEEERNIRSSKSDFEGGADFNPLAVNRQNHRSLKEKLQDVEAALVRVDDGSYGICPDCNEEIPKDRLRRAYWVKRDAPCQTDYEKSHPRKYW